MPFNKINRATIEKVKETAQMYDVVSEFVKLKKDGANWKGLSPFNTEKTPSFTVFPATNTFKDFSSGEQGGVIDYLMKAEKMEFKDAIRYLANKYAIEVEYDYERPKFPKLLDNDNILKVQEITARFFEHNFYLPDAEGNSNEAKSYMELRGFTEEILKKFRIGYAPAGWNSLLNHFKESEFSESLLEVSGVTSIGRALADARIVNRNFESRKYYDTFRDRIMFPIMRESDGSVIGFNGRVIRESSDPKKQRPKYLNTRDTKVFHKGQVLYGLNFAKFAIRKFDCAHLVEGPTDVLSHFQAGIENTVASSGTAVTEEHAKLIKKHTNNVIVIFDGDKAGAKAAFNTIDLFLKQDLNVSVVMIPDGKDPHEYINTIGKNDYLKFIAESKEDYVQFRVRYLLHDRNTLSPAELAFRMKLIIKTLGLITDNIARHEHIVKTAASTQLPIDLIQSEVALFRKERATIEEKWVKPRTNIVTMLAETQALLRFIMLFAGKTGPNHIELTDFILDFVKDHDFNFNDDEVYFMNEVVRYRTQGVTTTKEVMTESFPHMAKYISSLMEKEFAITELRPYENQRTMNKLRRQLLSQFIELTEKKLKDEVGREREKLIERKDKYERFLREHRAKSKA